MLFSIRFSNFHVLGRVDQLLTGLICKHFIKLKEKHTNLSNAEIGKQNDIKSTCTWVKRFSMKVFKAMIYLALQKISLPSCLQVRLFRSSFPVATMSVDFYVSSGIHNSLDHMRGTRHAPFLNWYLSLPFLLPLFPPVKFEIQILIVLLEPDPS